MFRSIFLLCLMQFFSFWSMAQKHQWLSTSQNAVGTVGSGYGPRQVVDLADNIYTLGSYRGSIYFPADTISFQTANSFASYIAKYRPDGTNVWVKNLSSGQSLTVISMNMNRRNEIVLYGTYFGGHINPIIFGRDTLRLNRAVFVAIMDTSGNFISGTDLATGGAAVNATQLAITPNDDIVVTGYHSFGTKVLYDSGRTVNVTLSCCDHFLARFSPSGKTLRWHRSYATTQMNPTPALAVDSNDQIYMGFQVAGGQTGLGVSAGSTNRAGLAWYRGDGTFYKARGADDNNMVAIETISAIDSNFVFCVATTRSDSSSWNGRKFYKQGTVRPATRNFNVAFALRSWDSILWLHTTNFCSNITTRDHAFSDIGDGFIYMSLQTTATGADTFRFGGLKGDLNTPSKLCKIDLRGNVLWILSCPTSYAAPLNTIGNGDVVYSGVSIGTNWTFDPFSYSRTLNAQWNFIARTFDYSIVRGDIRSGPYCAGDTLIIPYTKTGDYDTSNVFIAEISDEKGEFLGKERELGRIKANTDSTVLGILPLFQVASSPLYRIRIRSTSPVVQSFFRLDTLRLLIYSRDKADPGPDTSICSGQAFTLSTFGGTSWLWSPSVNMDNPRLRTPTVYPDSSTTYTIIIGDSSGCGAPDTASVRITVRDSLRITETRISDTLACLGQSIVYNASFGGGLPSAYLARWYAGKNLIASRRLMSNSDSFRFTFRGDTLIYLVLSDSCSSKNDTAWFQTRIFQGLSQVLFPKDTLLCLGEEVVLRTQFQHPRPDSIRFTWVRPAGNVLVGSSDTLRWTGGPETRIEVELWNTCNNERIKGGFDLYTRPRFALNIQKGQNSDSLCYGSTLNFLPIRSGGKNAPATFQWFVNGFPYSSDSLLVINTLDWYQSAGSPVQTIQIKLSGNDLCSQPEAEDSMNVYLLPPLQLQRISDSSFNGCFGNAYSFYSGISGGRSIDPLKQQWWLEDSLVSENDTFNLQSKFVQQRFGSGSLKLLQVLSDGCSRNDSLIYSIRISEPPNVRIDVAMDTLNFCNGQQGTFKAMISGGRSDSTVLEWQWTNHPSWWKGNTLNLDFNKGRQMNDTLVRIRARFFDPCSPQTIVYDSVFVRILNSPLISFFNDSLQYMQVSDTVLCLGEKFDLNANVFYSKASPSAIRWYINGDSVSTGQQWSINADDYNRRINDSMTLMAVFGDTCSAFQDTAVMIIRVRPELSLDPVPDTTLCFGSDLRLEAVLRGGFRPQYRFSWTDEVLLINLSDSSILDIKEISQNTRIRIKTSDACSQHEPEQVFNIRVLDPLKVLLSASDTCFVNSSDLRTSASGGNGTYRYTWYENDMPLSPQGEQITVNPDRVSTYMVILSDQCTQPSDTALVRIAPVPRFEIEPRDSIACEHYVPAYVPRSLNADLLNFTLKNGSELLNGNVLTAGSYVLTLEGVNEIGCAAEVELPLRIKPLPDASFNFSPEDPSFDAPEVSFNALSPGLDDYRWYFNGVLINTNAAFSYRFSDTGTYAVRLETSLEECINETQQWLRFRDNFRYYNVSAFSPNSDGFNDRYRPVAYGIKTGFYTIYNRWGGIVFQGNTDEEWDGTLNGATAPAGTYQVLITLIDNTGKRSFIKEQLQLLR